MMEKQEKFKVDFDQSDCERQLKDMALKVITEKRFADDRIPNIMELASYKPKRTAFKDLLVYSEEDGAKIDRIYDEALTEHMYGPKDPPSESCFDPGTELVKNLKDAMKGKSADNILNAVVDYLIEHSTQGSQIKRFITLPEYLSGGERFRFHGAARESVVKNMDRNTCYVNLLDATDDISYLLD